MTKPPADWYRRIWSLEIEDMSWTEQTTRQVDFIIDFLELRGGESVLDLACGYGRHAHELSRRGFSVTGVDITPQYIDRARADASRDGLDAAFICSDIRDIGFRNDFDVVLNMADGAIGYLETDEENAALFDRIAEALKPNGKHLLDVCNAEYAESHFPMRSWDIGTHSVSLPQFDWDPQERRMLYGGWGIKFGTIAEPPATIDAGSSIRLYSVGELGEILGARGMQIVATRADYSSSPATRSHLQMEIYSRKQKHQEKGGARWDP
jgi:SAM-dependent methyltransferase